MTKDRYFLTGFCDCVVTVIHEHEVTKAEYVAAERKAGFYNTLGEPAGFGNGVLSGRIEKET